MAQLSLRYSDAQMREALKRWGYLEQIVTVWRTESCYHNRVETSKYESKIYIKGEVPTDEDGEIAYSEYDKYSLETVFERELRARILDKL